MINFNATKLLWFNINKRLVWQKKLCGKYLIKDQWQNPIFVQSQVFGLVTSRKFTVTDIFQGISKTLQAVSFQNNFEKSFLT